MKSLKARQPEMDSEIDPEYLNSLITTELCRRKLEDFVYAAWQATHPFDPLVKSWYIGCICEHLEALSACQILKLIINIPPRTLKSWLVSVFWPAWHWLKDPSTQWIYASYNDKLSERDCNRHREIVKGDWYRRTFNIRWNIKPGSDAKDLFENTLNGARMATTPGGKGAGFDSQISVCDDINAIIDAHNTNRLNGVNEWFGSTLGQRGTNPGLYRLVNVQQRVAENDLSGYLISEQFGFEHLVIPMNYEPRRYFWTREEAKESRVRDPIVATSVQIAVPSARDPRREEGEVLDPVRFTPEALASLRALLRPAGVASQHQQRPAPLEGTLFQSGMFRYCQVKRSSRYDGLVFRLMRDPDSKAEIVPLSRCRFFQTIDTAMTAKKSSDYTAVGTFAITPQADLIIFHMWRAKLEVPYQYPALKHLREGPVIWDEATKTFTPTGTWPSRLLFQAVENKASGPGLLQTAAADGIPFKSLECGRDDKVERSSALATMYYSTKVFHMEGQEWLIDFENEMTTAPNSTYMDQFDVASYAGILIGHDRILRAYLAGELITSDPNAQSEELEAMIDAQAGRDRFNFQVGGQDVTVRFDD